MRQRDHSSGGHPRARRPIGSRTGDEPHRSSKPAAHERHAGAVTTREAPAPAPAAPEPVASAPGRSSLPLLIIRYGIGWALVVVGFVLLIVNPGGFGWDGFGIFVGCGLSVLLLNYLYRIGVSGDEERRQEEEARRYLAEHGHWPDDPR